MTEQMRASQLQCPSCGEANMGKVERFGWPHILLSILTFGIYALVAAILAARQPDPVLRRGDRVKCTKCKSRWVYQG